VALLFQKDKKSKNLCLSNFFPCTCKMTNTVVAFFHYHIHLFNNIFIAPANHNLSSRPYPVKTTLNIPSLNTVSSKINKYTQPTTTFSKTNFSHISVNMFTKNGQNFIFQWRFIFVSISRKEDQTLFVLAKRNLFSDSIYVKIYFIKVLIVILEKQILLFRATHINPSLF